LDKTEWGGIRRGSEICPLKWGDLGRLGQAEVCPDDLANRRLQPLGHLPGSTKQLFVAIFSVKADGTVVTENAAKHGCTEKPARYREADRALVLAGKKREKREALRNVRHMRWAS
jgi:hypothetical protein